MKNVVKSLYNVNKLENGTLLLLNYHFFLLLFLFLMLNYPLFILNSLKLQTFVFKVEEIYKIKYYNIKLIIYLFVFILAFIN